MATMKGAGGPTSTVLPISCRNRSISTTSSRACMNCCRRRGEGPGPAAQRYGSFASRLPGAARGSEGMRVSQWLPRPMLGWVNGPRAVLFVLVVLGLAAVPVAEAAAADDDMAIALSLAEMLRASRAIVSAEQSRIDDPQLGDKGLTGQVVLDRAIAQFRQATGIDPAGLDPASRQGRLLRAM